MLARRVAVTVQDVRIPVFSLIADGVCQALKQLGFEALLVPVPTSEELSFSVRRLTDGGGLAGLISITTPWVLSSLILELKSRGIPVVTIETWTQGAHFVSADNRAGGRLVAEYLKGKAGQFIAVGGPHDEAVGMERIEGFTQGLAEAGVALDRIRTVRPAGYDLELGRDLALGLDLGEDSAVFCAWGDAMSLALLQGFAKRGLRPPADFRLVSYDDLDFSGFASPALTTVHQPLFEMGELAAEIVLESLENPGLPLIQKVLPPRLIVRESA